MIPLIITGFGNVGRAFLRLVHDRDAILREQYNIELSVQAVLTSKYMVDLHGDSDRIKEFCDLGDHQVDISGFAGLAENSGIADVLDRYPEGVLVEGTPTDLKTGEPGLSYVREALNAGWHVVIANKGPLVVRGKELAQLAIENGCLLKMSGAAAAALPTIDVGETACAGSTILSVRGILNGTTNYILSMMTERKISFDQALSEAQKLGIAESEPSLDVEGWDTAAKTVILSQSLFSPGVDLADLTVSGITAVSEADIAMARSSGEKLRLIGRIDKGFQGLTASVGIESLASSDPLYSVEGGEKGIVFNTDTLGEICVIGGASNPVGTAASMLKDLINIYK